MPKSIQAFRMTDEEYIRQSEEYGGYCLMCREPVEGVEPDAREYECEYCGFPMVYGIEELLIMGLIQFEE